MYQIIHIINWLLPLCYALIFSLYLRDFLSSSKSGSNYKRIILSSIVIVHLAYLVLRTIEFQHPPITNKFEIFTILAFAIAFSYLLLDLITGVKTTGVFVLVFSLIFQLISSLFIEDLMEVKAILRSNLLGFHVFSALLGYAGITVSAVYGTLFLILYKKIKISKFDLLYERLPSLELLERLSFVSLVIGFVLLTVSIVIGAVWLPNAFPGFSYTDPKLINTGIVWLIYLFGISLKLFGKWYGKKVIYFSIAGFVFAMLTMAITSILESTFHSFTN